MKNNELPDLWTKENFRCKHLMRIMRISTILLIICVFCSHAESSHSQNAKVSVHLKNSHLDEILNAIEAQTDYLFIYNNDINTAGSHTVKAKNRAVADVLKELFSGTDIRYKMEGTHILLTLDSRQHASAPVSPQTGRITGVVLDMYKEPVIGANIVIKGSSAGTITDIDGRFDLEVPSNAVLVVSYVGYKQIEVPVGNQPHLTIQLAEDTEALDEVVVIGYGVVKKKDLTGSVSQLSAGNLKDLKVSHPSEAMAGQMAGVQVQQVTGNPGEAATIRVRGAGSISASSSPLYVVDGYPLGEQNLNSINPSDIESIEVLKDASAAAIYGSRAANGVVLVTTRSGKAGKVSINLDVYFGLQNVTKKMDMMNAQEFAALSKEAFNNNYIDNVPGAKATDPLSSRPSGMRYRYPAIFDDEAAMARIGEGTDWQDEIFRTAPVQNYQLSVTGGDEKTKYMFSAGYFSQDGVIVGSDYERFSARAKIDSEFTKWLKVGINLAPTYMNTNKITQGHWADFGVINAALATAPVVPVRNEDGSWASQSEYAVAGDGLSGVTNAVANAKDIDDHRTTFRFFGNLYAELSLLSNLKFKTTIGTDIMEYHRNYFRPSNVPGNGTVAPLPSTDRTGRVESTQVVNWLNENTLNYYGSFGLHEVDGVVGFTAQKNVYNHNFVSGSDFPDDIIRTLNNAKVKTGESTKEEWALLSYLGRVNYRFNNKYYLTASIRADGSSRFGKNNRYGYFPSGSVAWRISQEEFMKKLTWLSDMKLRASYGLTGTNAVNNYAAVGTMENQNYVFGAGTGNVVTGAAQKSFSNADLTWEKTRQIDIGLEMGFINNRISLGLDYYERRTTDLLLEVDIPTITGFAKSWRNIGKVNNKGLELVVNTVNVLHKDFSWNTSLNMYGNRNKVIALGPEGDPIYGNGGVGSTHVTMIGHPMGSFYGYKQIGVYMNQEDWENSPKLADSKVGDVKFADINGDKVIDADDRTIIGNNEPTFSWGMTNQFTYKNFDLSIVLQGVHGRDVLHLGKRFYTQLEGNQNQMREMLNRWRSPENPGDGMTPRANSLTTGQNNAVSSRWVEDASFVRINNLTLGYTLPLQVAQKCAMQYARVYFSVQNLATFTGYSGYNPETSHVTDTSTAPGTDYGMYPLARTITLGINVTF
ncbi:MAG: TonB-dependent receptor [Tannerellaceae bacterium]|nr:TonB-dependent receptor [Tannerellaceae bacterium]